MYVQIFKLGEEDVVTTFPAGLHILGRGPALQCNDKRVSRNHATIEVMEDNVIITSTHINPCFLKVASSKTITIIPKDSTAQLNNGDTFAFLPDDCWFKIRIIENGLDATELKDETKNYETVKRQFDSSDEEAPPDKKSKVSEIDESKSKFDLYEHTVTTDTTKLPVKKEFDEKVNLCDKNEVASNQEVKQEVASTHINNPNENQNAANEDEVSDVKPTIINTVDDENPVTTSSNVNSNVSTGNNNGINIGSNDVSDQNESTACENKVDENSSDVREDKDNNVEPSTSNPKPHREKCWYGANCYRKNPIHRQDYTHPGDSDFESDPDDKRPTCSFGAACYRKNKHHRGEYKHPPGGPQSKTQKKRSRKKVVRPDLANSDDLNDLLSDSEDPFIADDDSDEYVESSEDDSGWEDSQNVDEDSENIKRLVKEANKFAK